MSTAEAIALRASDERIAQLPLRRLFPLLLPANLLRNAMLQRSAQSSARYGSMAATDPWRVRTGNTHNTSRLLWTRTAADVLLHMDPCGHQHLWYLHVRLL